MTDNERDDALRRIEGKLDALADLPEKVSRIEEKVDAVDNRVSDVAQAVRELGGDIDEEQGKAAV